MAVELATGYISLAPSARGFESKLKREVGDAGTKVGDQIGRDASSRIETHIGAAFSNLARLAVRAGAIIGAASTGLAAWGIKSAADLQQTQIAFEGILGSGEAAASFLEDLRAFAARTPFEFPELQRAAKNLLATGTAAEDVIPVMTTLGNVAATLGVGGAEIEGVVRALGQMKGKGKASAEELQQISEQIPGFSAINAIAQDLGVTTSEAFDLMADGAIDADTAIAAILAGMDKFPGAAGAMERQAKTLNGVLSTLKDTARDALVAGVTPALEGLTSALQAAGPTISTALTAIGSTFGNLITRIVPIIERLLPTFTLLADLIGRVVILAFDSLAPVIDAVVPALDKFFLALAPLIVSIVDQLAPVLAELAPAFIDVGTSIAEALLPVVEAVGPLLADLARIIADTLDAIGPWPIIIGGAALALGNVASGFIGAASTAASTTVTLGSAFSNAVPLIGAFSAAFAVTTLVLEKVFGKADDVTGKLNELTDAAGKLSSLSNQQLAPAFEDVTKKFQDSHPEATKITAQLGALDTVARDNIGTAARIAEQFKDNTELYALMQNVIRNVAEEQRQQNEDTAAGTEVLKKHEFEVLQLKAFLESLPPQTDLAVNVEVDAALAELERLRVAYNDVTAPARFLGFNLPEIPQPRAAGGSVSAGSPYVVGERRAELFVPNTNGTILPFVPGEEGGSFGGLTIEGGVHFHQPIDDPARAIRETTRNIQVGAALARR